MSLLLGNKQLPEPEVHWTEKWRTLKVATFTCGLAVILFLSLSLSLEWLEDANGAWNEGLFGFCVFGIEAGPKPFDKSPGCYKARRVAYIRGAAALFVVALCADVIVTMLTLVRTISKDHHFTNNCGYLALGFGAISFLSAVAALVLCPVGFALDMEEHGPRVTWTLAPGYVLGWTAALAALCELVLQFYDSPHNQECSTCQTEPGKETAKIQVAVIECEQKPNKTM